MSEKLVIEKFNVYVEEYKILNKLDTYIDTVNEIIDKKVFDFITYHNIKNFLNESTKQKLEIEYSNRNMMKPEYKIEEGDLF